jgi:hypothetical protein
VLTLHSQAPTWNGQASLSDGPLAGDPHSVAAGVGRSYTFWKGTDGGLWVAWYNAGWHGPMGLGGQLASDPHPVATGGGTVDVFWKGSDGNLWHVYEVGGGSAFAAPSSLGGGPLGSEPAPASSGHNDVAVFWKGTDNNLWEGFYRPGQGWRLPVFLGSGPLNGSPHAASFNTNAYDVFWKGTDKNIWHTFSLGSRWSGPQGLGMGPVAGDPVAISAATNTVDLYWPGTDTGLWHGWYQAGWHGPQGMGGLVQSAPSLIVPNPGQVDVFWRNGADIDHLVSGVPTALGETTVTGNPSAFSWGSSHEEVFWKGADAGASLWHGWEH